MTPFYTRFPELAARETRCIHIFQPGGPLPPGEYGFVEFYCEEPRCDCRRVLLRVTTPQAPDTGLATINFGWEDAAFYTRWMHGDADAGREITAASLDPINSQSQYADHLLEVFRDIVKNDAAYVARLARHYEMFKDAIDHPSGPAGLPDEPDRPPLPAMTIPEILRQLQRVPEKTDFAPYESALRAAADQREAITPELIAAIDRVSSDPAHYLEDPQDCLHLFAIYLLAQFRENPALDCFLRFFALPGDQALDLTGDLVTEQGAAVLASVCGGDPAPLLRLIHDESVNEFVRTQAMDALAVQSLWGERLREAVVEDLRGLFHTLPKPGNAYVWAGLTGLVCDFHVPELAAEARQAFAEQIVDESILDLNCLEEALSERGEERLAFFRERNEPIDAMAECSSWRCFRDEDEDEEFPEYDDGLEEDEVEILGDVIASGEKPYLAPPKVGRNEPCPCGSGRKYKKCCGQN